MFCKSCWANLPDGTRVCPRCGVDPCAEPSAPTAPSSNGKRGVFPKRRPAPRSGGTERSGSSGLIALLAFLVTAGALYHLYTDDYILDRTGGPQAPPAPPALTIRLDKEPPSAPESSTEPSTPRRNPVAGRPSTPDRADKAVAAYKEGDYHRASILFRGALRDSPESSELKGYLAQSLAHMADEELKAGEFDGAKRLFTEAITIEEDPAFLRGLANAQVKLGDIEGAVATIEPLKAEADVVRFLKGAYSKLGQEHYQSGDIDRAIDYFEKGAEADPGDAAIRVALSRLKKERSEEEGFGRKEGSHFLVKFEGGENAVAGHLIGLLLEEAYRKIGTDLGYYPEDRIGAVLYSREKFRDVTGSPSWAGAIYDGRIKIPVGGITERTNLLEKVMFHEYTHALVHRISSRRAPVWINEGLAQYEEGKRAATHKALLRNIARNNEKLSLRQLEGSFMGLDRAQAQAAYALSLSATEYIIRDYGVAAVVRILEGLGRGKSLDEAISSALYVSYRVLEEGWLASLKR
ncbi:MAG: tetratricopeptide repeat protein [Thermodesulfobacteriota bacterium]